MANEQPQQQQTNVALTESAVFADGVGTALRIKAAKNKKGEAEKEGVIELLFMDSIRQRVISSVIVSRLTAIDLVAGLNQTLVNFDKELASKEMPKAPEIKTSKSTPTGIR
ncbi:MAG: hypothetical protein ACHQX1_00195 [Candidatus Micrarchaeales archaeon]